MSIETVLERARNQMEFLVRGDQKVQVFDLTKRKVNEYTFSIKYLEQFENRAFLSRDYIKNNAPGPITTTGIRNNHSFYLDELIYDAQLGFDAFRQVNEWEEFQVNSCVTYLRHHQILEYETTVAENAKHENLMKTFPADTTGKFSSLENGLDFSQRVLKKHAWIKDYAEKHFLLIFHLNYTDKNFIPKYLYGFPVWEVRPSEPGNRKWK